MRYGKDAAEQADAVAIVDTLANIYALGDTLETPVFGSEVIVDRGRKHTIQ